jgi:hypothetical protein
MRWMTGALALAVLAGCTPSTPPASAGEGAAQEVPPSQPRSEFQASHHAVVEGVVTSRGGQPLDSVTLVAWRLAEGRGSLLQLRAVTDAGGRFRLPVEATVGPEPTPLPARVVIRAFAYASRYPRGPSGSVAMDSTIVPVTLVPRAQTPGVSEARLTLPLP